MHLDSIEAAYPLSPLQQGMLFHSLYAPDSGVDILQLVVELREDLDVRAFRQGWQRTVERHAILRTALRWEGLERPLQEVWRDVLLPMEEHDWRDSDACGCTKRLEAYLRADRSRGFDLSTRPLMRLALFHTGREGYQLVWTIHHVLVDSRSMVLILDDAFSFYEAFRAERDLQLSPPCPYREHISWLEAQDSSRHQDFWRELLRGFAAPTPLPMDTRTGDGRAGREYRQQQSRVPRETTARLEAVARSHGLTMNTLVQGAWAMLLSRYGGEDEVVFGAVWTCRSSSADETVVGPFINTLPVRVRFDPQVPLLSSLQELRRQNFRVLARVHTPLTQVHGCSEVPAGTPLFRTVLSFEPQTVTTALQRRGCGWADREVRIVRQPGYPLTLSAYHEPALPLTLTYDSQRFEDATVARMLVHLQRILEGFAGGLERTPSAISLLTEDEWCCIREWTGTEDGYRRGRCVHELFEAQVRRTPQAPAVECAGEVLTYGELNRQANRLGHYLRKQGVGPEVPVAICMERGLDLVVGILGVLKAGGVYVPLDPVYPAERLAFMLADARVPVLLTKLRVRETLPPHGARTLCIDAERERIAREREDDAVGGAGHGNAAYTVYTSGSTGRPKGVQVEHGSLVNLVSWHQRAFSPAPGDRATLLAGIGFDASVWELWPYLASGSCVHVPDEEVRTSPLRLRDWLVEKRITLTFLPTPLAEAVLPLEWPADTALRLMLTGGDRLLGYPPSTLPFVLVNNYGPTESTVVATSGPVAVRSHAGSAPSIGRGISNTRLHVLDALLEPVPVGVPGELYIGGAGLARGYLNRPELTAGSFVPDPFGRAGARMYRTGDRVRWLSSGELEFMGRVDGQVKIRGFRIEPGEIESVLADHRAVRECVVAAREGGAGERRLVGYVVPAQGAIPRPDDLRRHLRRHLPEYMVPGVFVFLDALPLTAHGKVDRRALPVPERPAEEERHEEPRTPAERVLAGIWSEVLKVEGIGIHDHFFELGGHSLQATQVVSRIRQVFKVEPPVRLLFEAPTVAALSAALLSFPGEESHEVEAEILGRGRAEQLLSGLEQLSAGELDLLYASLTMSRETGP